MRMRKKKWADPWLEAHDDIALAAPTECRGKWHELLDCQLLHVELGAGKGGYLNTMARMYPDEGWIGLEKDRSAAAVAARKAVESGEDLSSRRFIVNHAENLADWFAPGEIDVLHLNFSDPWPKKSTHKRRLSSDSFLAMYRTLLAPDGIIAMKTDNKDLFEASVIGFVKAGFCFREFSVDYRRTPHEEDAITEYEQRFLDLGQPIYRFVAAEKEQL